MIFGSYLVMIYYIRKACYLLYLLMRENNKEIKNELGIG